MNLIGSHDRPRAINALSGAGDQSPPAKSAARKNSAPRSTRWASAA
jgi:hypothetical protein